LSTLLSPKTYTFENGGGAAGGRPPLPLQGGGGRVSPPREPPGFRIISSSPFPLPERVHPVPTKPPSSGFRCPPFFFFEGRSMAGAIDEACPQGQGQRGRRSVPTGRAGPLRRR